MNSKISIRILSFLICILFNTVNSQIISVASGSSINIASGTVLSADGLDITPSSNFSLNSSVSRTSTVANTTSFPYIPRVYQFSPATNAFSGTLKINYFDNDLVGMNLPESNLKVIYHTTNWTFDSSSTNDAAANSTISNSLSSVALDEIALATCLPVSNSKSVKLSNQSTHAVFLSTALSSWSVSSGVDAADFSITPSGNNQELIFNTPAVYSNPQDSNSDNIYLVNVSNGCEIQNLTLTISPLCGNWDEDGNGRSRANAAVSAYQLKQSYPNSPDGVYWIDLPNLGPTQVYCIMDSAYDGGGWMLAMKATRGTTFNYSSTYWTTTNTLNPTDNTRNNGDAKYATMNNYPAKDMLAVWPDIPNNSSESGSIDNLTNWTWLQNNFHNGATIVPITFFSTVNNVFKSDATQFNGKGTVFSSQVGVRFYGFNYTGNSYSRVRWGFGWNENNSALYPNTDQGSNDVSGGLGMDNNYGNYSAGDRIQCCSNNTGINRSARVELYIR